MSIPTKMSVGEKKSMKAMMTPEEAYDKGFYQIANILAQDRRIRESLGMSSLHDAIRTPKGRGRPKNEKTI